mgnify:CR=1 FL=1
MRADLKKYETDEENNKEIMETMNQQTQLYQKELKEFQDRNSKIDKELKEKTQLVVNLN